MRTRVRRVIHAHLSQPLTAYLVSVMINYDALTDRRPPVAGERCSDQGPARQSSDNRLFGEAMDMKIKAAGLAGSTPTGQVGRHYRTQLKVKDGIPPYQWEIAGPNELPSGLTLDVDTGTIYGIPSQEGNFRLTVIATDKERATAQRVIHLSIWPERPDPGDLDKRMF